LSHTFYYGIFERPVKSDNWYQGKHEPLITKELFDQVQAQLKRDNIQRENKEFSFTKLFTCGYCGSGISAEEKWKDLKDGTHAKYVYYSCSRARDRNCKNKYIREEDLILELLKILDKVDINELGMRHKLEDEIARFNIFQRSVLGTTTKSNTDKREFLHLARALGGWGKGKIRYFRRQKIFPPKRGRLGRGVQGGNAEPSERKPRRPRESAEPSRKFCHSF
jgi:hypothetical protein